MELNHMRLASGMLLALLCALPARAEIYECNGTWTNKPCAEGGGPKFEEKKTSADDIIRSDRSKKKTLISRLDLANFESRRSHGFSIDAVAIEDYCLRSTTSVDECANRVSEAEDRLIAHQHDAALVHEQQRANEIEEEKLRRQSEESSHDVVVVQNNFGDIGTPIPIIRRPGHSKRRGEVDRIQPLPRAVDKPTSRVEQSDSSTDQTANSAEPSSGGRGVWIKP